MKKTISKIEMQHKLKEAMEKNVIAIDFVEECIRDCDNLLGYNPDDEDAIYAKENLEYLKFTLYYLDNQYMKSFKQVGGKL